MRRNKLHILILSIFVLSSLLVFTKPVSAEEDSVTSSNRNEDRGREEIKVERKDQQDQEDQQENQSEDKSEAEKHRNVVSTFVKNILKMSEKHQDGIGKQVREVARDQEENASSTAQAIKETEERSKFKTFLIGTDYKNLGMIRSSIVKTANQIEQLNRTIEKLPSSTERTDFENQVKTLEQQQTKLDDFVKAKESIFSLFGWFVKLFTNK